MKAPPQGTVPLATRPRETLSPVRSLAARAMMRTARRTAVWVAGLGLLLALGVRVALLADKPFWRDEALVALLVESPLAQTIRDGREVPIGFLAAVKAVAWALPDLAPEVAYRLLPLAAGMAAVALLPLLARSLRAPAAAPLAALWLSAGLPAFVYYSRELKPYALDLLLAVAVPLLAWRSWAMERPDRRAWAGLLGVLLVAPWVSFGGLFMVTAALAAVLEHVARRPDRRQQWGMAALLWLSSLAAVYILALRRQAANWWFFDAWRQDLLLPGAVGVVDVGRALFRPHAVVVPYLFPFVWPGALLLVVVGLAGWPPAERRFLLWLWLGAGAAASAAGLANLYMPWHGRLLLFLAPPLVMAAAAGLARLAAGLRLGAHWTVLAAAALSLWWSGAAVAHRLRSTQTEARSFFVYDVLHDVEPLISRLDRQGVPGRRVMVSRYAASSFRYYSRGRLADATVCWGLECLDQARLVAGWLDRLPGEGWMILIDQETGGHRQLLARRGFEWRTAAQARGTRLWQVTRRAGGP
jgi:hypothetical protein